MSEPREYTVDEIRSKVLAHVRAMVEYWAVESRAPSVYAKLDGLAFSLLVMLDGGVVDLPSFVVAPSTHPTDKEYLSSKGENYYPETPDVPCDIAGPLHEQYAREHHPVGR